MAWFYSKYYKTKTTPIINKIPERFTQSEARERSLAAALRQNLEQQRRTGRLNDALSPGVKKFLNEAYQSGRPKAVFRTAAYKKALRTELKLEAMRSLRSKEGSQNAASSGADRRQFSPVKDEYAKNIYGSFAALKSGADAVNRSAFNAMPGFMRPMQVVPCIQRHVRKEVLFAKKKAGRGYRVSHKRGPFSGVPC